MTVAALNRTMSAAEFRSWQAYLLAQDGHEVLATRPAHPAG